MQVAQDKNDYRLWVVSNCHPTFPHPPIGSARRCSQPCFLSSEIPQPVVRAPLPTRLLSAETEYPYRTASPNGDHDPLVALLYAYTTQKTLKGFRSSPVCRARTSYRHA